MRGAGRHRAAGAIGGLAHKAAGAADGSFPLADPTADAALVQSVVWAAAGLNPTRDKLPRAEASRQVRSFCERALGVIPEA